ncbi:hypothetical protein JMUB7513_27970 [Staphylococcus aureus]
MQRSLVGSEMCIRDSVKMDGEDITGKCGKVSYMLQKLSLIHI